MQLHRTTVRQNLISAGCKKDALDGLNEELSKYGKDGFFFKEWVKQPYSAIACCNDGLRHVVFKLETMNTEVKKDI